MPTVGAKNQPIVQTTDSFNPVNDINTLSNWVANNYGSVKILTGSTVRTSLTGADLFAGLTVWEQSTGQFWQYNGTAWVLQPLGTPPRAELIQTSTQSISTGTTGTVTGYSTVNLRGGFTHASGVLTVPVTGRYNVTAGISWTLASGATGYRITRLLVNGGINYNQSTNAFSGTLGQTLNVTGLSLTAGDTLAIGVTHNQGTNTNIDGTIYANRFIVEYVGA
jgi:hypothetical protein